MFIMEIAATLRKCDVQHSGNYAQHIGNTELKVEI